MDVFEDKHQKRDLELWLQEDQDKKDHDLRNSNKFYLARPK
jgi:hypothetical protein